MIDLASDLATVFYVAPFAKRFARVRPAVPDVEVMLILGTVDREVLEERSLAAIRTASFAAGQDVRADDRLVALEDAEPAIPAGTALKVLDKPRRVNDGLEVEALLGSVTP